MQLPVQHGAAYDTLMTLLAASMQLGVQGGAAYDTLMALGLVAPRAASRRGVKDMTPVRGLSDGCLTCGQPYLSLPSGRALMSGRPAEAARKLKGDK